MQIRPAALTDSADIAILAAQLGYPNLEKEIRERLEILGSDHNSDIYVCEWNQRLVGWIQVVCVRHIMVPPFAEIGGLVVAEHRRGHGAGKALLHQAEIWAKERGLTSIWIRSNIVRTQAHEFYLQQGYHLLKSQQVFRKVFFQEEAHESNDSG